MDVMVGLVNEGQEPINVTNIAGSLNSPYDFNYYMQNFTQVPYNAIIHEDEELTLRYQFKPMSTLDLNVEYTIALTAFYENDEELFSETFFNGTVTFYESGSTMGTQEKIVYVGCIVAIVGFLFSFLTGKKGSVSLTSGGGNAGPGDEWVSGFDEKGANFTNKKTMKKQKRKVSGKKKKN